MAYRPKLRGHVRVEGAMLFDDLLRREVELEGAALAVAVRLDGGEAWGAIRAGLMGDGHDVDDLDSALRGFLLLHYVEGAGDALTAKLAGVVHQTEEVPLAILGEARFACQGSGACCSGYAFGPLSDADVARIDSLDLAAAFPEVTPPWFEEREGSRYLTKVDDRCVFLAADRRCGLHGAFGAEAKPQFCRMYPLDSFGTVEGIRVVDRGTCATFGVSARSGLPLYDDMARVSPLLDAPVLHHPVVLVEGRAWDYGLFLRFTDVAIELVQEKVGTAADTLHAIARCLDALAQAMAVCPLEPGQPDDLATAVLALDGAGWYRSPRADAAARGVRDLGALIAALAAAVNEAIDEGRARSSTPRFREFAVAAEQLVAAIANVDDAWAAPAPAHGADVEDALRISMRQQLFGRHVLADGYAGAGLVRIGLIQLFALAGARQQAGARPLTAADLSRGHMLATRVFQTGALDGILADHEPRWRQLVDGLWLAARVVDRHPR